MRTSTQTLAAPAPRGPASARLTARRQPGRRAPLVPLIRAREADDTMVLTVADFMIPPHRRLAASLVQAALVRDVAAFGALILFSTMLALILGGDPGL
ncbi:hypothetical protein [Mongoliimonas terrestris]|uniref:hypothetical protein n=1 Tax=Mongoliimonas terrestris TaxID=1709001 RepID=UPI000AA49AED|nr:hypothetical protein [Mongoliimonas terrestris]